MKYFDIVKASLILSLTMILAVHHASAADSTSSTENTTRVMRQAPDFSLRALDGEQVSLDSLQEDGHVLLLFWSLDCVYCMAHMPDYQRLYENYKDKGLSVAAINIGGEYYEDIAAYAEENQLEFLFLSNRHHNYKVAEQYAVISTPTLVLVSPKGEVLYRGHVVPDMSQWFVDQQKVVKQELP